MEIAIQVVWWIGLLGALLVTLFVLKQVFLLLRVLKDIHRLGEIIRDAARGLADNAVEIPRLQELAEPAREMRAAVDKIAAGAASVRRFAP